jgi:hypothetical protein
MWGPLSAKKDYAKIKTLTDDEKAQITWHNVHDYCPDDTLLAASFNGYMKVCKRKGMKPYEAVVCFFDLHKNPPIEAQEHDAVDIVRSIIMGKG